MSSSAPSTLRIGVFVGGRGSRLGGVAKGNLELDAGERLVTRLVRIVAQALPEAPVVLVGAASAYGELGLPALDDDPPGVGPLGGLRALLLDAERHGAASVLALACDLPHLGPGLVTRLGREQPAADFLAPRDGPLWHTLVARYSVRALDAVDATLAGGERALQRVIGRLGARAHELVLNEQERAELHDWDSPEDVAKSKGYAMDIRIKQQPELRCFCVRHLGPYQRISEAFDKLHRIAVTAGLEKLPNLVLLAVYHDDPEKTPPAQLRSDAALVVAEGVPLPGGAVEQRLPAGRYAMTTHVGPYERLGDAWARFRGQSLPASGERVAMGATYEIYRNTPADTPPDELVTELYVPLA